MTGDDVLRTWADVARRIGPKGRGAPFRLAQALGMNSSYFYRKLKSATPLTAEQAEVARAFLADEAMGAETPAPRLGTPRELPVYGWAAAGGEETIALNEGRVVEWLKLPMGLELGPGEWFAVRAIGSSMEPRIFPGEYLVVRRDYQPARNKDVIVEFSDGSGVVKTYRGQSDGKVHVEQFNPAKTVSYDATSVRTLHAVALKL